MRIFLLLIGMLCSCLAKAAEPTLRLRPCNVLGTSKQVLCGRLRVFENRGAAAGRMLKLMVLVLPATGPEKAADPVFRLAGGPGQAASSLVAGTTGWDTLRRTRDIVFVDQRGTGRSHPLQCRYEKLQDLFDAVLTFNFRVPEFCRDQPDADLAMYTTQLAADDLDQVREALGYETINLWGGSYGTRVALVYARRYPGRVRSMVLQGVNSPTQAIPLGFPKGAQAALNHLWDDCAADPMCNQNFPDSARLLERLLARLEREPARVDLKDPRHLRFVRISYTRDHLAGTLLYMLYGSGTAARIPAYLQAAGQGDFQPLAEFALTFSQGIADQLSMAMTLSVLCSEDLPQFDLNQAKTQAEGTVFGHILSRNLFAACRNWPKAPSAVVDRGPITSTAPALLISGAVDPVTPPWHAEEILSGLPNGKHIIVPNSGHFLNNGACFKRVLTRFILAGGAQDLDQACLLTAERPPFFQFPR